MGLHLSPQKNKTMLEYMKTQRLIDLKNQSTDLKAEATKAMEAGDLKGYFKKLELASKLQKEISETLAIKV